jgi:hypothetical protein
MAVLGTAQMAITLAQAVVAACLVQQVVHSQVLKEHKSQSNFLVLTTIREFGFFINK